MPRKISQHAITLLSLIDNAATLSVVRSEYALARDVIRATQKICSGFGFEVENEVFEYMLEAIGDKPPQALREEFDKFATMILVMDHNLDKHTQTRTTI